MRRTCPRPRGYAGRRTVDRAIHAHGDRACRRRGRRIVLKGDGGYDLPFAAAFARRVLNVVRSICFGVVKGTPRNRPSFTFALLGASVLDFAALTVVAFVVLTLFCVISTLSWPRWLATRLDLTSTRVAACLSPFRGKRNGGGSPPLASPNSLDGSSAILVGRAFLVKKP